MSADPAQRSALSAQRSPLAGARVVLGVTGSIAAYKAVALASALTQAHALVDVVLTREAAELVRPLSFQAITHRPAYTDMFHLLAETEIGHVTLGHEADVVVVAPATAHTLARLALGLGDDLLATTALATRAPLVLAPAMETNMLLHPATQGHLATLRARGALIVEPGHGRLASGAVGVGRLAEPEAILDAIRGVLGRRGDLAGWRVVVTAGGTQEPIDPVRVIANRSSGKMGYAVAEAARGGDADYRADGAAAARRRAGRARGDGRRDVRRRARGHRRGRHASHGRRRGRLPGGRAARRQD
jgi:phosphopantothenoylcysteine decarboxylase/phosphopantothenate--cysteine ligase